MNINLIHLNRWTTVDPGSVGGKAAGLARLFMAGANVPEGFVVPGVVPLTARFGTEILAECEALAGESGEPIRFAVRSSATAEDGGVHSYAGMYATVLNVGLEDVVRAVRRCRISVNSPRLISYRISQQIDVGNERVSVVVQRMLNPSVAGVCFSVDPVTGSDDYLLVEAVRGVGEALVSGAVTPDLYRIRKSDGVITEFLPGAHSIDGMPIVPRDALKLLHFEALRLSKAFGYALDLEFAIEEGKLYLLQARPVTAWKPPPSNAIRVA